MSGYENVIFENNANRDIEVLTVGRTCKGFGFAYVARVKLWALGEEISD